MNDDLIPLDPGARSAILAAAASLEAETETLLARLVRHPSTLGRERGCLGDMEAIYRELGHTPFRVDVDVKALADHPGFSPPLIDYAGRSPVAAVHRPRAVIGRSLMLQGHIDVVPEGAAELWTTPQPPPRYAGYQRQHRGRTGQASPPPAARSAPCSAPNCSTRRPRTARD